MSHCRFSGKIRKKLLKSVFGGNLWKNWYGFFQKFRVSTEKSVNVGPLIYILRVKWNRRDGIRKKTYSKCIKLSATEEFIYRMSIGTRWNVCNIVKSLNRHLLYSFVFFFLNRWPFYPVVQSIQSGNCNLSVGFLVLLPLSSKKEKKIVSYTVCEPSSCGRSGQRGES